jgi:hypothetical protein
MALTPLRLGGIGLAGYRSFRGPVQLVGPLGKVNLLAGQNNAGKSNVLRFAASYLGGSGDTASETLAPQVRGLQHGLAPHRLAAESAKYAGQREGNASPGRL